MKVIVGSRESKLAVIQSEMVIDAIRKYDSSIDVSLLTMKTTGDMILDKTLDQIGGKGLFVKELDKALLEKRADLTVHSLKDMPMEVCGELPLIAFSRREDPRDVLILREGLSALPKHPVLGAPANEGRCSCKSSFPMRISGRFGAMCRPG